MNKPRLFAAHSIHRQMIFFIALALTMMGHGKSQAQCTPVIQNVSVSASQSKCGWTGCVTNSPPVYYLINTYTESVSASETEYNSGAGSPVSDDKKCSLTEKHIQTENPTNCTSSDSWSGTANYSDNQYPTEGGSLYAYGGSITNASTGDWDPGGFEAALLCEDFSADFLSVTDTPICTATTSGDDTTAGSETEGIGTFTSKTLTGLSKEYTDTMLRGLMMSELPAYSTNWSEGGGTAFYSLSCDHVNAAGGKMKYRFFLCSLASSQKGQSFKIKWKEVTTYPSDCSGSNSPPSIVKKTQTVTADGNPNGMYTPEMEVDVPATPSSITETDIRPLEPIPSSPPGK